MVAHQPYCCTECDLARVGACVFSDWVTTAGGRSCHQRGGCPMFVEFTYPVSSAPAASESTNRRIGMPSLRTISEKVRAEPLQMVRWTRRQKQSGVEAPAARHFRRRSSSDAGRRCCSLRPLRWNWRGRFGASAAAAGGALQTPQALHCVESRKLAIVRAKIASDGVAE